VLAVIVILITLVAPSFQSLLERRRLEGAAETLYADLYYAKSEAVKRSVDIEVDITSGANWSYDINIKSTGETLKSVAGSSYTNIQMAADDNIIFSSPQGMPDSDEDFIFSVGADGEDKTIAVNVIGRIKLD